MKKRPDIDVRLLRIFEEVAATGSLSAASIKLDISQSAISQALAQLEQLLGTQVLDRNRRPFKLTAAGIALHHYARQIIEDVDRLISNIRNADLANRPVIRVGMIDSCAATFGPDIIKDIQTSTSKLLLWAGLANGHAHALINRQVDLIITSDPLEDMDKLVRRPLFTEPFIIVAPQSRKQEFMEADLATMIRNHPLIRFSARSHFGTMIDRYLRRTNHAPQPYLEVDTGDVVMAMIAADLGWAITTPLCLLQSQIHLAGITAIPLPGPALNRTIFQLSREGEFPDITARCYQTSRNALENNIFPQLRKIIPWLGNRIALC